MKEEARLYSNKPKACPRLSTSMCVEMSEAVERPGVQSLPLQKTSASEMTLSLCLSRSLSQQAGEEKPENNLVIFVFFLSEASSGRETMKHTPGFKTNSFQFQ